MKWIRRLPEESSEKTEQLLEAGWKKLKEPKNIRRAMLYALPISLGLMAVTGAW